MPPDLKFAEAGAAVDESTTSTVKENCPWPDGTPEIAPEEESVKPSGNAPAVTFHEYGAVPPVACNCVEYCVPWTAAGTIVVSTSSVAGVVVDGDDPQAPRNSAATTDKLRIFFRTNHLGRNPLTCNLNALRVLFAVKSISGFNGNRIVAKVPARPRIFAKLLIHFSALLLCHKPPPVSSPKFQEDKN